MTLFDELHSRRDEIHAIAAKYGVDVIRVFGSVARGEEQEGSDIDLLIRIARGRNLIDMAAFQYEIEDVLKHKTDVVSENGIYHLLRDEILGSATTL